MGSYANDAGHPSLFVFALLDTPLGGPPYFFLTGLAGGFGYNRSLQLPSQHDILNFPLVQGAVNPPSDPNELINELNTYIQPDVGEYWFAAGVTFTTFELLNGFALLTVELGNELEIALLGVLTLKIPPDVSFPVAEAQLALEAKLIPSAGIFSIAGGLTPNSYILSKDCRLTGGFAFDVWFGSNPHAGDFLVTFGGYNKAFNKPAWYPDEARVGFDWVIGPVTIKGGCYFALTPHAVMAGGGLSIVFAAGPLRAWLKVYADFLIAWKPFYYEIDVGVSVGASLTLYIIVKITLTIELGAQLVIWGPKFAGKALVSWFIISFTIRFGSNDKNTGPPPLTWPQFQTAFLPQKKASNDSRAPLDSEVAPTTQATKIRISQGIVKQTRKANSSALEYTVVNAHELQLLTQSSIPCTNIVLPSGPVTLPSQAETDLSVWPMQDPSLKLQSTHTITMQQLNDDSATAAPTPDSAIAVDEVTLTGVPSALWGMPSENTHLPSLNTKHRVLKNVITGTILKIPQPVQPGGAVGPLPITRLEYQHPYINTTLSWGEFVSFPAGNFPSDPIPQIAATISAQSEVRDTIISQLRAAGLALDDPTPNDLSGWSEDAAELFFEAPVLSYLGDLPATQNPK